MTTEAIANNFKVCQTFLGAKIHDPKDPSSDLSEMLVQVVVTLFNLMDRHHQKWMDIKGSKDVPTCGFRYHVGLEPVKVNIVKMLDIFRTGISNLKQIWTEITGQGDFGEIEKIGGLSDKEFRFRRAVDRGCL